MDERKVCGTRQDVVGRKIYQIRSEVVMVCSCQTLLAAPTVHVRNLR